MKHGVRELRYPNAPSNASTRILLKLHNSHRIQQVFLYFVLIHISQTQTKGWDSIVLRFDH